MGRKKPQLNHRDIESDRHGHQHDHVDMHEKTPAHTDHDHHGRGHDHVGGAHDKMPAHGGGH